MKNKTAIFNYILLPLDILLIITSFALAYYVRLRAEFVFIWPFADYLKFFLYFIPVWILIFATGGLYSFRNPKKGIAELYAVITGASTSMAIVIMILFLTRTLFFSRLVIVYSWVFNIILISLGRWTVRYIQKKLFENNIGTKKILIVGNNKACYDIIKSINDDKGLGYRFLGILTIDEKQYKQNKKNIKYLGSVDQIEKIYKTHKFDVIILTEPNIPQNKINKIQDFAYIKKIDFKEVPNLFQVRISNTTYSTLHGIPIINFRRTPLDGWGSVIKRIFDIFTSSLFIVITSPIMLITALAIRIDSKGPIIYKNERVGNDGKRIFVYKFRYMKLEYCTGNQYGGNKALKYEKELIKKQSVRMGPLYKIANDPRKTRVGAFIEKYKIDELPQFFNVLLGTISIVGPRPHQPREVEKYQKRHHKLFQAKPGVTGLAQISGSSDLNFEEEFKLDLYYIENWSLWNDIKIILKTPGEMFRKRKNTI